MPPSPLRLPARLGTAARSVQSRESYAAFFLRNLWRALRPRTFSDHVRRRMLFDRRPFLSMTADKARARDYVREKVGEHVLKRTYAIAEDPRTIDWSAVPRTYVCKATHASRGVIVVSDDADPGARLPTLGDDPWSRSVVRPEHAPTNEVTEVCLRWVRTSFGWGPGSSHEHQYRHIPPRVIVEELLRLAGGPVTHEYELYVFHGRCEHITVASGRSTDVRLDFFRPDWTRVKVGGVSKRADVEPPPPPNLAEMVRIAEALGAETDFVRVDLYDLGDRVVFGELTNTPNAGTRSSDPNYDRWLGAFWARGR